MKNIFTKFIMLLLFLSVWLSWDIMQAGRERMSPFHSFKPAAEFNAVSAGTATVAIVRSNDTELAHPTPVDDAAISYQTIEDMVSRAVELTGGFAKFIKSGDMVLLKPNIVDPEPPGSGEVTDVRVIKALIKLVDQVAPGQIEIVVGEGAPRPMDYELKYQKKWSSPVWTKIWDAAGFQELLTDPYLEGINLRFSNLNGSPPSNPWQDLVLAELPDAQALPQNGTYWIHKDVLNADVFITVPVMKIHTTGITVALKNQIGLAPSTRYGFSKTAGVPQDNYAHKLIHGAEAPVYWTDKEIVDLCNIAAIKYNVVDAIACLETQKSAKRSGNRITNLVRMNAIIAGADPVAVDHVCARLMSINPDDVEHITLAERVGLGTNNPDNINIVGADLDAIKKRFKKNSTITGDFGQSNREWLLKGPYVYEGIDDPMNHAFIADEAALAPAPGVDGWSEAVYFMDDRINLKDYYDGAKKIVSYVFTYFDAPENQQAEFWLGSDESMQIFLNGELVYDYDGYRSFGSGLIFNDKAKIPIKAGENRMLVKVLHKYSNYDFSLNICEPESNSNYDGDRVWGLKFKTTSGTAASVKNRLVQPSDFSIGQCYPNPFNSLVTVPYRVNHSGQLLANVYNVMGEKVRTLSDMYVESAGPAVLKWDGLNDYGQFASTGTYFVRIQFDNFSPIVKKVAFVK